MFQAPRSDEAPRALGVASVLLASAALAAGCSSGSSGSDSGGLTVAITDAASDELASFVVDVVAVELTRVGGSRVGVLPDTVTVDLVELSDASQILNVMNVPAGVYSRADVTLDFTSASAYLIDETTPATLLDGDGMALTGTLTLPVLIGNSLAVAAGRHRILELDFDLDHSVMVDAGANSVSVEPALVMRVDRTDPKDLLAGGYLTSVDTTAGTFELELRTRNGTRIGEVVVSVDAATVYQVDGVPAQGAPGLTAMAGLIQGTWVQMYGAVDPVEAGLTGAYVEAGTGTYHGGQDILEGHVTGRVGGAGADAVLTVLGHAQDSTHTSFTYNSTFTVSTSFLSSKVAIRGEAVQRDTDCINVGQRVRVFGTRAGFTMNANTASSVIRLQPTHVFGLANGAIASGTLDLDVTRIGLRDVGLFAWGQGGPTPPDPDALQVATGSLGSGLGIAAGTAVDARGFFSPIDDAAEDATAASLVNLDTAPRLVLVIDRAGGIGVAATAQASGVSVAISGAPVQGEAAHVSRPLQPAQALPASPDLSVVRANGIGLGIYVIRDRLSNASMATISFDVFASTLDDLLAQGAQIYNLGALGAYDAGTNTVAAGLVTVAVD